MASNLCRRISSSIAEHRLFNQTNGRLIATTIQVSREANSETTQPPISEDKEKIHDLIEEEAKHTSRAEESDGGDEHVNKHTGEIGGPRGPEPTRYGDWEKGGRCSDF